MITNEEEKFKQINDLIKKTCFRNIDALNNSEVSNLLKIFRNLKDLNIELLSKRIYGINMLFFDGSQVFAKLFRTYAIIKPYTSAFDKIMSLFRESENSGCWIDFLELVLIGIQYNPRQAFIEALMDADFLHVLLSLLRTIMDGIKSGASLDEELYIKVTVVITTLITQIAANSKAVDNLILRDKIPIMKIMDALIYFGTEQTEITNIWEECSLKVIDAIFMNATEADLYNSVLRSSVITNYVESILPRPDLKPHHILVAFRVLHTIFRCCEKSCDNSTISRLYHDFETFCGYDRCLDLLRGTFEGSETAEALIIKRKIIDILLFLSFHGDASSYGYEVLTNKATSYNIVRNTNSIKILVTYFIENRVEEFDTFIVETLNNYLHLDHRNYGILSDSGALKTIIKTSMDKSIYTQSLAANLFGFIIQNFSKTKIKEIDSVISILKSENYEFAEKMIKIFVSKINDSKLINQLMESEFFSSLQSIYASACMHENVSLLSALNLIYLKLAKNSLSHLILFNNSSPFFEAWEMALQNPKLADLCLDTLSSFLIDQNTFVLDFIIETLNRLTIENIESRFLFLQLLNKTYQQNMDAIKAFLERDGYTLIVNQIVKIEPCFKVENSQEFVELHSGYALKIIVNAFGLILSLLNHMYQTDQSYSIHYVADHFNILLASIQLLECFNVSCTDLFHKQRVNQAWFVIKWLFKIAFNDRSLHDESINSKPSHSYDYSRIFIKYPMIISVIVDLIAFICQKNHQIKENNSFSLVQGTLKFLITVFDLNFNVQRCSSIEWLKRFVPPLQQIWKTNTVLSSFVNEIFYRFMQSNSAEYIIKYLLMSCSTSISFEILDYFTRYKYKSILWCDLNEQRSLNSDVFDFFVPPTSSVGLSETEIKESSEPVLISVQEVPAEYSNQAQPDEMHDFIGMFDEFSTKILVNSQSTKEKDITERGHLVSTESIAPNSEQWKLLKSFLVESLSAIKKSDIDRNISADSMNVVADQKEISCPSTLTNKETLANLVSFISDTEVYNNRTYHLNHVARTSSYFQFCVSKNKNSFIYIPKTILSSYFKIPKYGFDRNIFKGAADQQFSYSIWFQFDCVEDNRKEDYPIYLLSMAQTESKSTESNFNTTNFFTVAYYPCWQVLTISTKCRTLSKLDFMEKSVNSKLRACFSMDLKEKQWYNISLNVGYPRIVTGKSLVTIYVNGKKHESFSLYFDNISNTDQFLDVYIGSIPDTVYPYDMSYKIGCIFMANKTLSDDLIQFINDSGPDGLIKYDPSCSSRLFLSNTENKLSALNKNSLFYIIPNRSEFSTISNFERKILLNKKLSILLPSNLYSRITLKNANYIHSLEFNSSSKIIPFCWCLSTSFDCVFINKCVDLHRAFFCASGINIFVILIEQASDSESLFNSLNRFFSFVIKNYFHLSKFVSSGILDVLAHLLKCKHHLLELRIVLLFISLALNKSSLSESFLRNIIKMLILDFDMWFGIDELIELEIFKFISNVLMDKKLCPITLEADFLDTCIVDPILISTLRYPFSLATVKVIRQVIKNILLHSSKTATYKKLMLFVLDALLLRSSFNKWSNNSEVISRNAVELSEFILTTVCEFFTTGDIIHTELFDSVAGIQFSVLLLNENTFPDCKALIFKIFCLTIINRIKFHFDLTLSILPSLMVRRYEEISKVYPNIMVPDVSIQLDHLLFYISKMLFKSNISLEQLINYLFGLLSEGSISDVEQYDLKSSLENFVKFPVENVRRFTDSTFYSYDNRSSPYPNIYFCPNIVITIINLFSFKLESLCEAYENDPNCSISTDDNLCMATTYFLQMVYFSLVSLTELVVVCAKPLFMRGIMLILLVIHHYKYFKEKTEFFQTIFDSCLKITSSILESAFTANSLFEISLQWLKPSDPSHYPQILLYYLVSDDRYNYLKQNVISSIMLKFYENLCNHPTMLTNLIKSSSRHILALSTLIHGQILCFGPKFDEEIFSFIINFARCVFPLYKEEINSEIQNFSCSLNKYLLALMPLDMIGQQDYPMNLKMYSTLLSVNSHTTFGKYNNDESSLKDVIVTVFFHCYEITRITSITTDSRDVTLLKEILARFRSIYDVLRINYTQLFNDSIYEMYEACFGSGLSLLRSEVDNIFVDVELAYYSLPSCTHDSGYYIDYKNNLISKYLEVDLTSIEFSKSLKFQWKTTFKNTKLYLENLLKSQEIDFHLYFSSYHNLKLFKAVRVNENLREIHEAIFHDGYLGSSFEASTLQRWQSLNSSSLFGVFHRLQRNRDFYCNPIFICDSSRRMKPATDYMDTFKEGMIKYLHIFPDSPLKDVSKFLFFLSRPTNLDALSILQHYLDKSQILYVFRTCRVYQIDAIEGLVFMTDKGLLLVDGLTLTSKNVIVESLNNSDENFMKYIQTKKCAFNEKSFYMNIAYKDLLCLRKKRYCLMSIAVELFNYDNNSIFLIFSKEDRKMFIQKLTHYLRNNLKYANTKHERNILYSYFEPLTSLLLDLKVDRVQQKWINREIDNFTYLLYLNFRAGRSFNDYSQYPIFPWIISDYGSQKLELEKETTFRCLSKPMGAQTQERLEGFLKRYEEWDQVGERMPKFMYATFYSTSMNTCSLLVRMEPYSSKFIELQGGSFDLPDRMFHSLHDSWNSSAVNSTADVKELTPEFYYAKEFLVNSNKFVFGEKQNGVVVDDVILPPWARNDPREYIRCNRAALESEYVSQNINNWIDLIFGYKQTGKNAISSFNVFHSWFYKGSIDLDTVNDESIKSSIISFINNFGQVPKKLFCDAHPKRKPTGKTFNIVDLCLSNPPCISQHSESFFLPIKSIVLLNSEIKVGFDKQLLIPPLFKTRISWERFDENILVIKTDHSKAKTSKILDITFVGEITAACFINVKYMALGCVNGNISIWCYSNFSDFSVKFYKFLYGHETRITHLIASSTQKFMLSGSMDGAIYQWDTIDYTFMRKITTNQVKIVSLTIVPSTSDIVVFNNNAITVYTVDGSVLASTIVPNKISCGISLNNDFHDQYQHLAISTVRGIEIWRYGYETSSSPRVSYGTRVVEGGWTECSLLYEADSPTFYPEERTIREFKTLKLPLENNELVTSLNFESKTHTLYYGTSKGKVSMISPQA